MIRPLSCLFILLVFVIQTWASQEDSTFRFQTKQDVKLLKWQILHPKENGIKIDTSAALHGRYGLQWNYTPYPIANCSTAILNDFWFSCYLRIEQCDFSTSDSFDVKFLGLRTNHISERQNAPNLFTIGLTKKNQQKDALLLFEFRTSREEERANIAIRHAMILDRNYRLEAHITFHPADSVCLDLFLDNESILKDCRAYYYKKSEIAIALFKQTKEASILNQCRISMDDFAISDQRPYAIPPKMQSCRIGLDSVKSDRDRQDFKASYDKSVFIWDSIKSHYKNESFSMSEWKIFFGNSPDFPVYHEVLSDPADCRSLILPFPLDSGVYLVQARLRNNFKNWGDWSKPSVFQVTRKRDLPATIQRVFFSDKKGQKLVSEIKPNHWYYLNVNFTKDIRWEETGYFIIYLNDSSYTFGTPYNKGGFFSATSSYIFNFSFQPHRWTFCERNIDSSIHSKHLPPDSMGLYTGTLKSDVIFDTTQGLLRFPVRLLPKANPGKWHLTAFLRSSRIAPVPPDSMLFEDFSNIYESSIIIKKIDSFKKHVTISIFIFICFAAITILFAKKKLFQKRIVMPDADFERITNFIKLNLNQKLTVDGICEKLGFNEHDFYAIFKRNNEKFSLFLNNLRIEKALELMNTSKSLSEIAFDVGFLDPEYFGKVFKKKTGLTPGEYRKSLKTTKI